MILKAVITFVQNVILLTFTFNLFLYPDVVFFELGYFKSVDNFKLQLILPHLYLYAITVFLAAWYVFLSMILNLSLLILIVIHILSLLPYLFTWFTLCYNFRSSLRILWLVVIVENVRWEQIIEVGAMAMLLLWHYIIIFLITYISFHLPRRSLCFESILLF